MTTQPGSRLYYDSLANPQFQLSVAVSLSFLFSLRTPLSPSPMLPFHPPPPPLTIASFWLLGGVEYNNNDNI